MNKSIHNSDILKWIIEILRDITEIEIDVMKNTERRIDDIRYRND
ncbi:hypothetical protein [Aquimarina atlantica]|nr:hypothetical protein [Aquimarina atlantica]